MEQKKLAKNKSEKDLQKGSKKNTKEKGLPQFIRTEKKSRTIIDKNPLILGTILRHSEYLDQNSKFCDYMEDNLVSIKCFNKEPYRHLFCIFDGHGGDVTSKLCKKLYPEIFRKCLLENPFDYESAIKKSFLLMDKEIEKEKVLEVGNTATIVFINNKLIYCSNVGDSSCCIIGKTNEFISKDDKCTNKKEIERIEKAGGKIIEGRLNGILAVSRGLGDFDLKAKGLISKPHITKKLIDKNMTHCVLASDGVWDVLKPGDIAKIIQDENNNIDGMAKIIVEKAKERGSQDNISCIVIELNKRTK